MGPVETAALAAGLSWASGLRLYAALFTAGMLNWFGVMKLPDPLQVLSHPVVLVASGIMLTVEFLVDKVPGLDSIWDSVHTFIRIPAGAVLAAGAFAQLDPVWVTTAAILGGMIAGSSHLTKSGARAAINTSPEPVTNWAASFTEDAAAVGGLTLAVFYPWVFLVLLAIFVVFAFWFIPKLIRFIRTIISRLRSVFASA
jgi:type II secretory pathway component PulF